MFKTINVWGLDFLCTDGAWSLLDDSEDGIAAMLALCQQVGMTPLDFWQVAPDILRVEYAKIEAIETLEDAIRKIRRARRLIEDSFRV